MLKNATYININTFKILISSKYIQYFKLKDLVIVNAPYQPITYAPAAPHTTTKQRPTHHYCITYYSTSHTASTTTSVQYIQPVSAKNTRPPPRFLFSSLLLLAIAAPPPPPAAQEQQQRTARHHQHQPATGRGEAAAGGGGGATSTTTHPEDELVSRATHARGRAAGRRVPPPPPASPPPPAYTYCSGTRPRRASYHHYGRWLILLAAGRLPLLSYYCSLQYILARLLDAPPPLACLLTCLTCLPPPPRTHSHDNQNLFLAVTTGRAGVRVQCAMHDDVQES